MATREEATLEAIRNKSRRVEYFTYSTGRLAALAPAANSSPQIIIQADSDFVMEKLSYYADLAGVAQTSGTRIVPNVLVQLTVTGSGVNLISASVPIPSIFGTGDLPFILPYPRVLPANSVLQINLTSFEAAVSPFITLNFHGRKVFMLASPA